MRAEWGEKQINYYKISNKYLRYLSTLLFNSEPSQVTNLGTETSERKHMLWITMSANPCFSLDRSAQRCRGPNSRNTGTWSSLEAPLNKLKPAEDKGWMGTNSDGGWVRSRLDPSQTFSSPISPSLWSASVFIETSGFIIWTLKAWVFFSTNQYTQFSSPFHTETKTHSLSSVSTPRISITILSMPIAEWKSLAREKSILLLRFGSISS